MSKTIIEGKQQGQAFLSLPTSFPPKDEIWEYVNHSSVSVTVKRKRKKKGEENKHYLPCHNL